ncbi:hypothetical protein AAG570_004587 [Ranatra chinensis]|uniref:Reverse transcriptase domain-containing protein n=1 Tax=Ranatra chinensis TaxID=642074 RepID=A0ABD0Y1D7_9HEMI
MPRKKGKSPDLDGEIIANIPVSNSFELLKNAPEVEITSKKDKIPPIVLNGRPANIRQFLEDTRKVVKDKFRITNRGRTTQILTSNVEDFEALKGLFRLRELEFHTFALRSEHMKRFVIHGLAEGFSAEEVEEELKAALPAVVRVVQMEKREGGKKRKIPVFIVTTKQEVTINDLKGVGDISLHTFRVEKYRSGDTPPQCFRCQRYGHTSRYCNLKEVCVKCSGNHHTKDCKEGAQVKCANCQKAHVASYRQCETRIAFLEKRSSAPIGQRTPAGPVTQRRQWSAARPVATNYSFSQALGNQQGSDQMGSNIGTRQTGTNTASIKNVISEMKLLDRDIKELNILPMLNLLKQMMTEIRNSQDSVGRLEILIKGTVIAAGDFNARHRLWGCQKKNKSGGVLYDFVMDRRAALVAPSNPTCVPCNGGAPSTLDLVLTSSHKCITDMRTVTEGGSDHLPVLFNIWGRAEANVKRPIYNFAQTDWDLFRRSLDLNIPTASPPLDTPCRIEAAVESLTREINEAIRISTPTKSQLPPRVELPREIVELIKLKNAVRRRWQSQRREEYKKMMNQLQRAVRDKIAEWKTERWNKMLQNTTTRDNTFWNLLRRFNRQCGRTNPTLRDGSEVASTNPEKATLLAKYFSGVNNQSTTRGNRSFVEQVDAQVRRILTAPPEVSPTDTITETPTAKLYKHTTPVEIREVLTKLKTNKAPGSDGITNKVAKNISRKALTKLTNIINAILRTCHYPRQWKTATVVALPKPGKLPSLPSSYRPISLLSVLAKITDKIILSRLLRVTEALDIIPDSQFGFRRKHATTHQLSRVVSHVSEHMKSGRSTAMVSLDCEKAYDTVWTNGLLFRLTEYKFPLPLIKIMQSYLSDRNIRVRIGESLSEEVSLHASLPQGSVLSPWLFNIYTAHVLRSTTTPERVPAATVPPITINKRAPAKKVTEGLSFSEVLGGTDKSTRPAQHPEIACSGKRIRAGTASCGELWYKPLQATIYAQALPAPSRTLIDVPIRRGGRTCGLRGLTILRYPKTHLKPHTKLYTPGYITLRNDRVGRNGGSVAILLKESIPFRQIDLPTDPDGTETLGIKVILNNRSTTIINVYNPPNVVLKECLLRNLFDYRGTVIVAGDFNARYRLWHCIRKNANGAILYDFVMNRGATLFAPETPTYVPSHGKGSQSTLDLVLANSSRCISSISALTEGGSDHLPVYFELWGTPQTQPKKPRFDFRRTDWDVFRCALNNVIPTARPPLGTATDIDTAVVTFTEEITAAVQASTPTGTPRPQKLELPEEILDLIRDKNKVRRLWQVHRRVEDKRAYNRLHKEVRSRISQWRSKRWDELLRNVSPQDNSLWKLTRRLNRQGSWTTPTLRTETTTATTDLEKTELLAQHFAAINNNSVNRGDGSFNEKVEAEVRRLITGRKNSQTQDASEVGPHTISSSKHATPREIEKNN